MLDAGNHMTSTPVFFNEQENECYCNECGCFFPEKYLIKVKSDTDKRNCFAVCSEECAKDLKNSLESEGEEKFKIIK